MQDAIWDILFEDIRTLEEAYRLDDEMHIIKQQAFIVPATTNKKSESLSSKIRNLVSYKTYEKIKTIEEKDYINFTDVDALRIFFELGHKKIEEVPRIQMQVAFDINDQMLDTIYGWVKLKVPKRAFLDIVIKPQILAGCIIVYQGIYKDYSLRTALHNNARGIFGPILASVEKRSPAESQNKQ